MQSAGDLYAEACEPGRARCDRRCASSARSPRRRASASPDRRVRERAGSDAADRAPRRAARGSAPTRGWPPALLAGRSHVDGHDDAVVEPRRPRVRCAEEAVQGACDRGEHDVVDRAAEPLLHRLHARRDRSESHATRRCGPIGPLSVVGAGRRTDACERLRDGRAGVDDALRGVARLARGRPAPTTRPRARPGPARHLVEQQLERLGRRAGPGRRDDGRLRGSDSKSDVSRLASRDAVDQAVVDLRDQREAIALEPFDDPHLPERAGAVEALREDARRPASRSSPSVPGCGSAARRRW